MLRVNVILERLDMLGEYLEFLNSQQGVTYEKFKKDRTIRWAVERTLQLSIA